MNIVSLVQKELKTCATKEKAEKISSFFKTAAGQYAEKDVFLGVKVPEIRAVVKKYYQSISFAELQTLLDSAIHEERFFALQCLVSMYASADEPARDEILCFYLKNTAAVNNWDLVDSTAPYLLGRWSYENQKTDKIYALAQTKELWCERIAVVSTLYLIRQNIFDPTLNLAERFLTHRHDLMRKAVGWMLREVGKQNEKTLTNFLDKYAKQMPRTMLRYAIERLSPQQRLLYMQK